MAVNIEAAPGDFSQLFLTFPSNGLMTHANHFESSDFQGRDLSLVVMPDSPFRLQRLRQTLGEYSSGLEIEALQRTCADHSNYPLAICCHPDLRLDVYDQSATVASVVMDLNDRRLWLCDGHPCSTEYREFDYAALLTKEEQRDRATVGA
jgi:isopenicillin-N N-acyltransferase-like protein